MKFTFSCFVDRDLTSIATHIGSSSEIQSERMLSRIEAEIDRIRAASLQYQARPEIGSGARLAVVDSYLILFTASKQRIRIERVVHGSRSLPTLFQDAVRNG